MQSFGFWASSTLAESFRRSREGCIAKCSYRVEIVSLTWSKQKYCHLTRLDKKMMLLAFYHPQLEQQQHQHSNHHHSKILITIINIMIIRIIARALSTLSTLSTTASLQN